jgi:TRAP-type C4-dicarboxylate transport system substrate-binding protein
MKIKPLFVSIAALSFAAAAQAQTKWDMPTPYSDGEFHTINVRQFVEEVKKATGGQLDINVHSNGSLIKHPDILRAVSTGQVPIGEILLGQFGNEEPVFNADNVPFLAAGYDAAWKLYAAQKPVLEKKLHELIENGRTNDAIMDRMHRLTRRLLRALDRERDRLS